MHHHPSDPGDPATPDPFESELLDRFFAGETTEEEAAQVRRYLMAHADLATGLAAYRARLDHEREGEVDGAPDSRASLVRLRQRLQAEEVRPLPQRIDVTPAARTRYGSGWSHAQHRGWGVAAAGFAVLAAGIVALTLSSRSASVGQPPESRTYVTGRGQRAHVELTDGTVLDMAPGSKLRVAPTFGAQRRDVYLEGEAYFTVVHDERRPFTVFTANGTTRDVGTAFSVRSYPEDRGVRVVVREGKVILSGAGLLSGGDVGRVNEDGHASVSHHADVGALLGWMRGDFTYQNTRVATVVGDLSRWYGVDVVLADPTMGDLTFTGSLTGMRSRDALELVAATSGLQVSQRGAQYVLSRR
jgi:ferric-dicitrate binding protein FerR (iron transport regulator)